MTDTTPCVTYSNVFLHSLLDDGAAATSRSERREQQMLRAQAEALCAQCPMLSKCLTDAITRFDVAGFVAGTTRRQRQEIRSRLGIHINTDDLDTFAGVNSGRQFDRYEIYRMRAANPDQPLSAIAAKVGCSVSTVKRHLRRVEKEGGPSQRPARRMPTAAQVVAVADEVKRGVRRVAA